MGLNTYIFSNANDLLQINEEWDNLVCNNSTNPFLLSKFINEFIKANQSKGWVPLLVVVKNEMGILAVAPLMVKRTFGINVATFIVTPTPLSPDFVVNTNLRAECITEIINVLIARGITYFDFTVEACSLNFLEIQKQFRKHNFRLYPQLPEQSSHHNLMIVDGTWAEYCSLRGRFFKKEQRRCLRKLNSSGLWNIKRVENIDSSIIKEIYDIERKSWKEDFRKKNGIMNDETLGMLLSALQTKAELNLCLNWEVWLLYINKRAIAYCLVIRFKRKAFIVKGSHDKKWDNLYPGIFVRNEVIKSMFETNISCIDFLTDIPYQRRWASKRLSRTRIVFTKGIFANMYMKFYSSNYLRKIIFFVEKINNIVVNNSKNVSGKSKN